MRPIDFDASAEDVYQVALLAEAEGWWVYVRNLGIRNGRFELDADGYAVVGLQGEDGGPTRLTVQPMGRLGPKADEAVAALVEWLTVQLKPAEPGKWQMPKSARLSEVAARTLARFPVRRHAQTGAPPKKDYDWAFAEMQGGRTFPEVYAEWSETDHAKDLADPQKSLKNAIRARKRKTGK